MTRGKKRSGKKWSDHYTKQAKKDRYPARSVYKLQELQQKHRLIKQGGRVLDLGCAPGSWTLYASELVGPSGLVAGIDIKPVTIKLPNHAETVVADIYDLNEDVIESIGKNFDVVLSDMAPATTGNRFTDTARSERLCRAALDAADRMLRPGGGFVCKIFQGEDFQEFISLIKERYIQHRIFKPRSSRKGSREIYIIGIKKK